MNNAASNYVPSKDFSEYHTSIYGRSGKEWEAGMARLFKLGTYTDTFDTIHTIHVNTSTSIMG